MKDQRKLSRRDFLKVGAAVAVSISGLAACASPTPVPTASKPSGAAEPTKPPAAAEPAKITFVCDTINTGHVKVRDNWAKKFTEKFPNITVEHQPVPQDYNTKIQTLFAAGTPPDIYRYLQEVVPIITVVAKKMHLQLDQLAAADKYDTSDFRKDALNLYLWEGGLYALPRDYGNQNLFINLDLFQKAGIAQPPVDWEEKTWTFEKFLEVAKALTIKKDNKTEQWGFLVNRGWRPWASWVYNNGGTVVKKDAKGVATSISLDEPAAIEALQFLQDLMHKHAVAPRPDMESELGGFDLFATGKVGMMINNPSAVNQYRTITAFKWDVATLPIGKATRRGTGGGGSGWAAGAGTKSPKATWEFIKYISSAEAEIEEVEIGATTPARTSVATGPKFLDPSKPPANAKGFAQAQEYVVRDPVSVKWPEISSRLLTPNMDTLWNGSKSPADVVKAFKAEADALLAAG
ncbi:MAG TPA: extracellular solute-binding protein [Anaerolineaceae bacterium]